MAKRSNRKLIEPPEGTIPTEKIDEAIDDVLKKESAKKKKSAKKIPAKKKRSCRHKWRVDKILTGTKKLIILVKCEKCPMVVECVETIRYPNAVASTFTF